MKTFKKRFLTISTTIFLLYSSARLLALEQYNAECINNENVHIEVITNTNCNIGCDSTYQNSDFTNNITQNIIEYTNGIPNTYVPDTDSSNNYESDTNLQPTPSINETTQGSETVADNELQQLANKVVQLVNAQRTSNGLNELSIDISVQSAAQVRAKEIDSVFSHTRPNGTSCFTALQEQGVKYMGAGENIASGQSTAEQVMDSWMNSDGHRANILNSKFTKIGVGVYKNSAGRYCWSQMFIY